MKAVISTTYDSKYLYFLPITTWCWNKLGVDVICFMPSGNSRIERSGGFIQGAYPDGNKKMYLINDTVKKNNGSLSIRCFNAPEHKEATYAQCSRLYGACLDLPEDEILITGDVDMAVLDGMKWFLHPDFNDKQYNDIANDVLCIWGYDLVPEKQYPMCYARGSVKRWRTKMNIEGKSYQECLDDLLGNIEAEHFRGNYWGKDQETLFASDNNFAVLEIGRAKEGTQFATKRYDRDDSLILDRLSPDTVDFHMNRPGYEPKNFEIILKILQYHYPQENFDWLISYTEQYKSLL